MAKSKCVYPFPVLIITNAAAERLKMPRWNWFEWCRENPRSVVGFPGVRRWPERRGIVRLSFYQPEGKPWDWARARKLADDMYPGHGPLFIAHAGKIIAEPKAPVIELAARKRAMPAGKLAELVKRYLAGELGRDALAAAVAA